MLYVDAAASESRHNAGSATVEQQTYQTVQYNTQVGSTVVLELAHLGIKLVQHTDRAISSGTAHCIKCTIQHIGRPSSSGTAGSLKCTIQRKSRTANSVQ